MTKRPKVENEKLAGGALIAYKGFDSNLACRGFQYEIGKTYTHDGDVSLCESGFHACEYPLDVFRYYSPAGSRFAVVEQSGNSKRASDNTKICSSSISIKAEIGIAGLVKAAIQYTHRQCSPIDPASPASATGYYGAASATGYYGAASATGYQGVASATGVKGRARGSNGCAIVLVRRNQDGAIAHIRSSKVGENGVKPDTWYTLDEEGNFVEIAP